MTTTETFRKAPITLLLLGGAVLLALVGLARMFFFSEQVREVRISDGPLYETVDELEAASDLVVVGTIANIVETFTDRVGEPLVDERGDELPGLDKMVVALQPEHTLLGEPKEQVYIVVNDTRAMFDTRSPTLEPGQKIVAFLFDIPAEQGSAEILHQEQTIGTLYGVVGGKQGIFDVLDDSATSRSDTESLTIDINEPLDSTGP